MQLSFPSDKSIELAFKVGIAGTASAPQNVSVVLEKNGVALSFNAIKEGDDWKAVIDKPGATFGTGEVKMSVNVVLNNRLFTPMKSVAEIFLNQEAPAELPAPEPVAEPTPAIEEQPKVTPLLPSIQAATQEAVEEAAVIVPPKKITAEDIRAMGIGPVVKEQVTIVPPVRLQLLRSIEPGVVRKVKEQVTEAKQSSKTSSAIFRLKKTKIVFK